MTVSPIATTTTTPADDFSSVLSLIQKRMTSLKHSIILSKSISEGDIVSLDSLQQQLKQLKDALILIRGYLQNEMEYLTEDGDKFYGLLRRLVELKEYYEQKVGELGGGEEEEEEEEEVVDDVIVEPPSNNNNNNNNPYLPLINQELYRDIPKYMINRIPMDKLNVYIESLNDVFKHKYSFSVSEGSSRFKKPRVQSTEYDNEDTRGRLYITDLDIKNYSPQSTSSADDNQKKKKKKNPSKFRFDPTGRAVLAVLRHFGLMKESRGKDFVLWEMLRIYKSVIGTVNLIRNKSTMTSSASASTKILSNNTSDEDEEVLIQRNGGAVFVTYNRPKALNALTLGMIRRLNSVLPSLQDDSAVSVLIQKGTGRAFCAGGDVKQVVEKARNEASIEDAGAFFREEYALDHLLATYRKPVVSLWNGFVMGGGVGVSIHAPFRVATGKTVMAMPETQIGLYPDVGGSFFLSTAGKLFDGHLGTYLGLTGARLKGEECYWSGAATHYIHDEEKLKLIEHDLSTLSLSHDSSNSFKIVNDILETYSSPVDAKNDPFALGTEKRRIIDECFKFNTVEDIIVALRRETQSPFAQETLKTLSRLSPIALKLTLEQIRRGSKLKSLKNAFRMENSMSYHSLLALVTEGKSKDFKEGVRALLVDKTNDPKWSPETLESISKEDLEWYFRGVPKTKNDSLEVKFLSNMDYAQYPYNFGLPKERELTTIFKSLRRKSLDAFKQEVRKAAPYLALEKAGEQAKVEAFFQFVQTKGSRI